MLERIGYVVLLLNGGKITLMSYQWKIVPANVFYKLLLGY